MEKAQVTFAVSAHPMGNQVQDIPLMISVGSEGNERTFVFWRKYEGEMYPKMRFVLPLGSLAQSKADMIAAACGDAVYNFLLNTYGVQIDSEILP